MTHKPVRRMIGNKVLEEEPKVSKRVFATAIIVAIVTGYVVWNIAPWSLVYKVGGMLLAGKFAACVVFHIASRINHPGKEIGAWWY